jgi:hypothetical protein
MYQELTNSVAGANSCSAMEPETIQKNGVSPKDLIRSRRNKLKKNISVLMVVLMTFCLGFSSCLDDEVDDTESSLVGLWVFVNWTLDVENPTNPEAAEYEKLMMGLAQIFLQGTTIEFKTDRTVVITVAFASETVKGTWAKEGSKFTITMDGETVEVDSDEILNSGLITIKNGVLTISSDTLDEVHDDGLTYRDKGFTKYESKMTFKK